MAKRTSPYANMTASDLARITRERGLTKPEGMGNISEWANFLEAQDAQSVGVPVSDAEAAMLPAAVVEVVNAPNYKRWKKPELVALAVKRGMGEAEANAETVAELADWLTASDGVSEDEQAALDHASSPAQPENE